MAAHGPHHLYETPALERAVWLRRDGARLAALARDPRSLWLWLRELRVPVVGDGAGLRLAWQPPPSRLPELPLFLGLLRERAVFAAAGEVAPSGARWLELREAALQLAPEEAGVAALARALLHWHATHRHCGRCGRPTQVGEGGHVRRCPGCGLEIHPRTDPAVIVLVHRGDRCLLARSPRFPPDMYSTLAGFVEPGESPEAAVVREVWEEVGVRLAAPAYVAAQPWPFPQSLMLGFVARARSMRLRLDPLELADARWFTRKQLRDPARRPVRLPRRDSIARYLIECWLAGRIPPSAGGSRSRPRRKAALRAK